MNTKRYKHVKTSRFKRNPKLQRRGVARNAGGGLNNVGVVKHNTATYKPQIH